MQLQLSCQNTCRESSASCTSYVPAYLEIGLSACPPACLPACLPACFPICRRQREFAVQVSKCLHPSSPVLSLIPKGAHSLPLVRAVVEAGQGQAWGRDCNENKVGESEPHGEHSART